MLTSRTVALSVSLTLAAGCGSSSGSSTVPLQSAGTPAQSSVARESVAVVAGNPPRTQYHEFQANCHVSRHAKDDPIVYPGRPGATHDHTFFGNTTTDASSTAQSLQAGATNCEQSGDKSAYWTPTLFSQGKVVDPEEIIVYYKSGIDDYTAVRPFPRGLKLIAGDSKAVSPAEFTGEWSCGNTYHQKDFPAQCPSGSKLIARLKAPSCWDGVNLDSPNHRDHMAYPVRGACPQGHSVALPMLEFKVPYPVNGSDMRLALSSGGGYTFHEDFINVWDDGAQAALVAHCINGGRQCDESGVDPHKP